MEGDDHSKIITKRRRRDTTDRLSILSDELILRTLSFLSVDSLLTCQRISHRFNTLSEDSQLWKSAYYNRFVRRRAAKIPGVREQGGPNTSLFYSSRSSLWLEDEHLVRRGRETDWKRQYKLRHRWSKGDCSVKEVPILARAAAESTLVRLHEDVVVIVDATCGLRAFEANGCHRLLATLPLQLKKEQDPHYKDASSISIDVSQNKKDTLRIAVGFRNGQFALYLYDRQQRRFTYGYIHSPPNPDSSPRSIISAIAFALPYLITLTDLGLLSLYCFDSKSSDSDIPKDPPRLLQSLISHTIWPPQTLSVRTSSNTIIASIAYALPTYMEGWSVGLQELRLTMHGSIIQSRLTSSINEKFKPLRDVEPQANPRGSFMNDWVQPTALSYNHPYLLASHPDNTLTVYLVRSTEKKLTIGDSTRLYGHTSAISGIHIGDRGKAVSVSKLGEEIRVWELEGGITVESSRKRVSLFTSSVRIRPDNQLSIPPQRTSLPTSGSIADLISCSGTSGIYTNTKGWVGFDDEKVMVLRESMHGKQALVVYDFT